MRYFSRASLRSIGYSVALIEEKATTMVDLGYQLSSERADQGIRVDAGFDHVHVHQVDEDRSTFFRFYEREMLARVARL
jgi:hypothetical protein